MIPIIQSIGYAVMARFIIIIGSVLLLVGCAPKEGIDILMEIKSLQSRMDAIEAANDSLGTEFAEIRSQIPSLQSWEDAYKATEQYVRDCFSWQIKHPKTQDRNGEGYCLSQYGMENGGCPFEMRKKRQNGTLANVFCSYTTDPNDFIP